MTTQTPTRPELISKNIPPELKAQRQWVCWRYETTKDGKRTKVPYQPDGRRASSTDPTSWYDFDTILSASPHFDGIGIVCADGLGGVDLDNCLDEHGQPSELARRVVDSMNTYTEITPSGRGLRCFFLGQLPAGGRRNARDEVEMYDSGRYLTVTGHHLEGTPAGVDQRTAEAAQVHDMIFGAPPNGAKPPSPNDLDDQDLLARAQAALNGNKFSQLWAGNWNGDYGSQSEADLALCSNLAFWAGGDAFRVDRLFRRSGLMREKWDERHGANGQTYGQLTITKALQRTTEFYQPSPKESAGVEPSAVAPQTVADAPGPRWPEPLDEAALYGIAGDVVRAIAPHTEADPAALLINFLVAGGNAIGRGPYASVSATRHHFNLFAVLVGETAKGRKGTSWDPVKELYSRVDPTWAQEHVASGLSSGEGLIWAVRDQIEKAVPVKQDGKSTGAFIQEVTDQGVRDKRLLVFEAEYASVLKVMAREGNTLSPVVRLAWDTGSLRSLVKNSPARATGAHISILGHVVRVELLRHLNDTEQANGFGNRFLWVCTRRAQVLPEGGGEPPYGALVARLHSVLEEARKIGQVKRDDAARRAWAAIYPDLSEGRPGLLGAMTARAEAQVLRLSGLYALLDGSSDINGDHLSAAIAVWDYCQASAEYIFGDALGDPVADRIVEALAAAPGGFPRTAINRVFGSHVPSSRVTAALELLEREGKIVGERRETAGRTAMVWRLA